MQIYVEGRLHQEKKNSRETTGCAQLILPLKDSDSISNSGNATNRSGQVLCEISAMTPSLSQQGVSMCLQLCLCKIPVTIERLSRVRDNTLLFILLNVSSVIVWCGQDNSINSL